MRTWSLARDGAGGARYIVADTFGPITINGPIDTENAGVKFGFGARHFGEVGLKPAGPPTAIFPVPVPVGDYTPPGLTGDFIFRVY